MGLLLAHYARPHTEILTVPGAGQLAQTNAAQVTKVRQIIEGLGLEIATPDDAREILELKGGDKVAF